MKRIIPTLAVLVAIVGNVCAQEKKEETAQEEKTVKAVGFSSQFLVSTDFKGFYFNMVGGQIRYTNGDFAASIAIMPTLRFHKDEHLDPDEDIRPFVTPGFSVGPLFQFKRWMLGFPISYCYDTSWQPTMGFVYWFGKL